MIKVRNTQHGSGEHRVDDDVTSDISTDIYDKTQKFTKQRS